MKFSKNDIGKTVVYNHREDTAEYPFHTAVLCTASRDTIFECVGVVVEKDGIHDCDGACKDGHGVWVLTEDWDLADI